MAEIALFGSAKGIFRLVAMSTVLCLAFAFAIHWSTPTNSSNASTKFKRLIKAQRFLYDYHPKQIPIIGSSMSSAIPLPPPFVDLGMPGSGPLTGIELLHASGHRPQVVLVEVNQLLLDADRTLLGQVLDPVQFKLEGWVRALRAEFQPVNFVLSALRDRHHQNQPVAPAPPNDLRMQMAQKIKQMDRDRQLKMASTDRIQEMAAWIENEIAPKIEVFRQRGIDIVFFVIPTEASRMEEPDRVALRKIVRERFPVDQGYMWVPSLDYRQFQTSDGVHLTNTDAEKYSQYLQNWYSETILN